jgi:hypothetical protein
VLSRLAIAGISWGDFTAASAYETLNPLIFQWPTKQSLLYALVIDHGKTLISHRARGSTKLLRKAQDFLQAFGVLNRVPTEIIIKIEIRILPPCLNLLGPGMKLSF